MKTESEVRTTIEQKGHQLLLLMLTLLILTSPFVSDNPGIHWLESIILMAVLLAAAYSVSSRGGSFRVALLLGIPALLSQVAAFAVDFFWLETFRYAATPLFLFWVCFLLLKDIVLHIHMVTLDLIVGSVNVYLMLGLGFALVFALIEHLQPGSFTEIGRAHV